MAHELATDPMPSRQHLSEDPALGKTPRRGAHPPLLAPLLTGVLTWHGVGKLLPAAPHVPGPVAGVLAVAGKG